MTHEEQALLYRVALTMVPGIGAVMGRKLVQFCGDAEQVFRQKASLPKRIPRIGQKLVEALSDKEVLDRAEREVAFIQRYRLRTLFFRDADFPRRLKHCIDSPLLLYMKGNADLNAAKSIGLVGTRNATAYGKECCHALVNGLAPYRPLIVSGLAFGIDSCAHRAALEAGLPTVGVLGHGLDRIYPSANTSLAERMVSNGGLVTEFPSNTRPDRENFPMRNRIIAGMCDAVVVVEAARKGGALITADVAGNYNRDVFAVPGRIGDLYSEGANYLVKINKAALIQGADDVAYLMNWQPGEQGNGKPQRKIYIEMTPDEEILVGLLQESGATGIDELCLRSGQTMNKVSAALLNLEFEGIVRSLPGKVYTMQ